MHNSSKKIGLVLSGGGAKGAYQIGVLKALAEQNISIDAVAGTSIGALNGAIVAASPSLNVAAERLKRVWDRLPEIGPLQYNSVKFDYKHAVIYAAFLASSGLRISEPWANLITQIAIFNGRSNTDINEDSNTSLFEQGALFSDKPLQQLLQEFLDITALQNSIPLYVSVFEQESYLRGGIDWTKAQFLGIDNLPSRFEHIQSLPIAQQKETLLASAALPLLFKSRTNENGTRLTDGGQGGWIKSQGNTPVTPLVEMGCEYIIVNHLDNGSLWHRVDFPETTFIEIRPNPKLDLTLKSTLDFSAETSLSLQKYGYEDTLLALDRLKETLDLLSNKRESLNKMQLSLNDLELSTQALHDVISQLPK